MTDDSKLWGDGVLCYVPPFQPPSQELLDMLYWINEVQQQFEAAMQFEFTPRELGAACELTPLQVDSLLTRGHI